jgi:uncharacterized protein involved in exopolysaccharide biosynthesis
MPNTELATIPHRPVDEITLRDALAPLFRHDRLLIISFAFLLVTTIALAVMISHTYAARMKVLVNRERMDPLVTTETAPQVQIPPSAITEEEVNSEAELLSSQDILQQVVLDNHLDEKERHSFRGLLYSRADDSRYVSLAVKHLSNGLKIETPLKTNIIDITYKNPDPWIAYGVLKSLSNLYVEKHVEVHRPSGSFEFFSKEADKYQQALEDSEARLAAFSKEQGVAAPDVERTNIALIVANTTGQLVASEQAVAADQERIHTDQLEMKKVPDRTTTLRVTNASDRLLQDLSNDLLAAKLKRTQLLLKFEPSYPLVQEADQEIADTETAIAAAKSTSYVNETTDKDPTYELLREDAAKTRADLGSQRAAVLALRRGIQDMQQQMVGLDGEALKQQDLLREVKANEDSYLLYVSKREQERAANVLDQNRIANVAIAVPPVVPTLPQASFLAVFAIGFIVSLVMSAGLAYTADYLDSCFHTPADVINVLGIPIVAALPKYSSRISRSSSGSH